MPNAVYEPMLDKLQRLPEPLLQEVDAFIDFLQMRYEKTQREALLYPAASAEDGMDTYLSDLEAYEEMLAAGKITWQ